jgi:hypothetical protein
VQRIDIGIDDAVTRRQIHPAMTRPIGASVVRDIAHHTVVDIEVIVIVVIINAVEIVVVHIRGFAPRQTIVVIVIYL